MKTICNRALLGILVVCAVLLFPSAGFATTGIAHDLPGTPMPPSPFSGAFQGAGSSTDVYAINLLAGQKIVFTIQSPNGPATPWMSLFGPNPKSLSDTPIVMGTPVGFQFNAVVDGVYDLAVVGGSASYTITYAGPEPSGASPVYRFYNRKNGSHFYTMSASEKADVIFRLSSTYNYEGIVYVLNTANPLNNTPLYRFYNKKIGSHFYTPSSAERDSVIANLSAIYTYEGVAYIVCAANNPGVTPVYRFWNRKNGSHFYTASADERDMVIARWPAIYKYEGASFFIAP